MMSPHSASKTQRSEQVDRPHWGWWVSILFGMSLLAVLALSSAAYDLWAQNVTTIFSPAMLRLMLVGAVAAHIGEGLYAWTLAGRLQLHEARAGWAAQTVILGFPSLRLLLQRQRQ